MTSTLVPTLMCETAGSLVHQPDELDAHLIRKGRLVLSPATSCLPDFPPNLLAPDTHDSRRSVLTPTRRPVPSVGPTYVVPVTASRAARRCSRPSCSIDHASHASPSVV